MDILELNQKNIRRNKSNSVYVWQYKCIRI